MKCALNCHELRLWQASPRFWNRPVWLWITITFFRGVSHPLPAMLLFTQRCRRALTPSFYWLVVWNMAFIFPIILGIPTDFHIFQRGRLYHQPVILNHHESSLTIIKSPLNTIKSPLNLVYMRGHGMCHHWCHVSFASPVRKFVFVHVNAMCLGKPMATRQRWNMVLRPHWNDH